MLPDKQTILNLLEQVPDPEIPVLSVMDLGIVRNVDLDAEEVTVTITPTYSGCPAMDVIRMEIRLLLLQQGFKKVHINNVLSPAWTTDWMTEAGRQKLQQYGIAAPHPLPIVCDTGLFAELEAVQCPRCKSYHTRLVSQFGSTACKALYQCNDCLEPFDYFKCH